MPANPGLAPAVQAALQRRGSSVPTLGQVSPGAAMANPVPQPMNPSEMTQASAPSGTPTPTAPTLPKFEPQDRTDLITVALIEQMKNDNKLVKEQTKMSQAAPQPSPQPAAPAPMPPMGGGGFSAAWSQPMATSSMQGNYQYGMGKDYSGMSNYGRGKNV